MVYSVLHSSCGFIQLEIPLCIGVFLFLLCSAQTCPMIPVCLNGPGGHTPQAAQASGSLARATQMARFKKLEAVAAWIRIGKTCSSGIRAQLGKQDHGGGERFAVGGGERIAAPEVSCMLVLFMCLLCHSLGRAQNQAASQQKIVAGMPGAVTVADVY